MPPTKHLARRCAAVQSVNYDPGTNIIPDYPYKSLHLNTTSKNIIAGQQNGPVLINAGGYDVCYDGHHGHHLAVGAIIGIVIAGIVIIILVWWCIRRRAKGQSLLPIRGGGGGVEGGPGLFQRMKQRLGKGGASRSDEEKNETATVSPGGDPYGSRY